MPLIVKMFDKNIPVFPESLLLLEQNGVRFILNFLGF